MGLLTAFFDDMRRDTKGRLNRVLVVVDSSSASEALINMLGIYYGSYFAEGQHRYTENGPPHVKVLEITLPGKSRLYAYETWMEHTSVSLDDNVNRVGLQFDKKRVLEIPVDSSAKAPLETVLNCFAQDSRKEAASILWSKIISIYANQNNYDVVLWNDTATKIASKVLALTSQGRGFTLPWECGSLVKMPNGIYLKITNPDVYAARPLKDLSDTEITAYLAILHDTPLSTSATPTDPALPTTIDEMMINYIS